MVLGLALLFPSLLCAGLGLRGPWRAALAAAGGVCAAYLPLAMLLDDDFFYASLLLSLAGVGLALKCVADRAPGTALLAAPLLVPWGLLLWLLGHVD